jgi:hypothetical protein
MHEKFTDPAANLQRPPQIRSFGQVSLFASVLDAGYLATGILEDKHLINMWYKKSPYNDLDMKSMLCLEHHLSMEAGLARAQLHEVVLGDGDGQPPKDWGLKLLSGSESLKGKFPK